MRLSRFAADPPASPLKDDDNDDSNFSNSASGEPSTSTAADVYKSVVALLGGRLSYLAQAATHADMLGHARHMVAVERAWLQSQIGLIPDHDDDVMDEVRETFHISSYQLSSSVRY